MENFANLEEALWFSSEMFHVKHFYRKIVTSNAIFSKIATLFCEADEFLLERLD